MTELVLRHRYVLLDLPYGGGDLCRQLRREYGVSLLLGPSQEQLEGAEAAVLFDPRTDCRGSCCTMKKSRCRLWDCRRLWRKSCPTASIGDSSYQSCGRREVFDRSLSDRKAGLWPAFFIPTYCLVPVVREAHDGDIVLDGGSTVSVSSRFRLFFCESCVLDSLEYHFLCKSRQRPRRNLLCSCGRRGVPYILMASRGFLTFS